MEEGIVPKPTGIWLESMLTRELCRVPAPAQLWDRVQLPGDPRPNSQRGKAPRGAISICLAWASTAALLVVSAVGLHAYLKNEVALAAVRSAGVVHLQAACHLCHSRDELQAVGQRGVY